MTYRFGRISKALLRRTAIPVNDPDPEARRAYAFVPGLPEAYGSLGYASMGIGSMDRAIQERRRYGIDPDWDLDNDPAPIKSAKTRPPRTSEKRKMTYKFGRIPKRRALDSLRGMTPYEPVTGVPPGVPFCPDGYHLGPVGNKCIKDDPDDPLGGTIVLRPPKESSVPSPGRAGRRGRRGRRGR